MCVCECSVPIFALPGAAPGTCVFLAAMSSAWPLSNGARMGSCVGFVSTRQSYVTTTTEQPAGAGTSLYVC